MTDDEIDFYESRFENEDALEQAKKHVPIHAQLGNGGGLIKADYMDDEEIKAALEPMRVAGFTFTIEESAITAEDMWPSWPEDDDDDTEMAP